MSSWLGKAAVSDVLRMLLRDELSRYRGAPVPASPEAPRIDSLERLFLATCVNEFFCLHETGMEDRLLMEESLEAWTALVCQAIPHTSGLTFRTSGSTGDPKGCHHAWETIESESRALHRRITGRASPSRVVSWLPLHHLYGFMLGIAYPGVNGLAREAAGAALPALRPGDLVVSVPPRWRYLASSRQDWPSGVTGVTSTAPLPAETATALARGGLDGLLEIYGSSETGGVATRWRPDDAYALLDHWQREEGERIGDGGGRVVHEMPDGVTWLDERRFRLQGRRDALVSIGGINVSPLDVARRIEEMAEVERCAVRTFTTADGQLRLKAFVVPVRDDAATASHLEHRLADWPAAQRPVSITLGRELPTNAMGKLRDW